MKKPHRASEPGTPKAAYRKVLKAPSRRAAIKRRIEQYNADAALIDRKYKTAPEHVEDADWQHKRKIAHQRLDAGYNEDMLHLSTQTSHRSSAPAAAYKIKVPETTPGTQHRKRPKRVFIE